MTSLHCAHLEGRWHMGEMGPCDVRFSSVLSPEDTLTKVLTRRQRPISAASGSTGCCSNRRTLEEFLPGCGSSERG